MEFSGRRESLNRGIFSSNCYPLRGPKIKRRKKPGQQRINQAQIESGLNRNGPEITEPHGGGIKSGPASATKDMNEAETDKEIAFPRGNGYYLHTEPIKVNDFCHFWQVNDQNATAKK